MLKQKLFYGEEYFYILLSRVVFNILISIFINSRVEVY